jgi:hypothetical protein
MAEVGDPAASTDEVAAAWAALRRYALDEEGFSCILADAMGRSNAMGCDVRPM